MFKFFTSVLLYTFILIFALLTAEFFYRFQNKISFFEWKDLRAQYFKRMNIAEDITNKTFKNNNYAVFDKFLGWTQRPNIHDLTGNMNTIDFGIRKNTENTKITDNTILAVGSSFTAGSEVRDNESWPAHLEKELNFPVLNAGIGGYGTDQILLRGDMLFDAIKPELVIVSFLQDDIERTQFSSASRPKPYFKIVNNELIYYPPLYVPGLQKVTNYLLINKTRQVVLKLFSYFNVIDHIMKSNFSYIWYKTSLVNHTKVKTDKVKVTCLLLEKFRKKIKDSGSELLVLIQYGGAFIEGFSSPKKVLKDVVKCSNKLDIVTIDTFKILKGLSERNLNNFKKLYVMSGKNKYGHMSSKGNKFISDIIKIEAKKMVYRN